MSREEQKEEIYLPNGEGPSVLEPIERTQQHDVSLMTDPIEQRSGGNNSNMIQVSDATAATASDIQDSLESSVSKEEISESDIQVPGDVGTGAAQPVDDSTLLRANRNEINGGGNTMKIEVADAKHSKEFFSTISLEADDNTSDDVVNTFENADAVVQPIPQQPDVKDTTGVGESTRKSRRKSSNQLQSGIARNGSWMMHQGDLVENVAIPENTMSPGTSEAENKDDSSGADQGVIATTLSSNVRRRTAHANDLEMGNTVGHHEHVARLQTNSDTHVILRRSRLRQSVRNGVGRLFKFGRRDEEDLEEDLSDLRTSMHGRLMVTQSMHSNGSKSMEVPGATDSTVQYRLQATKAKPGMATKMLGWIGFSPGQSGIYEDAGDPTSGCACCGVRPNELVIRYLNWTFRASFVAVIFSGALAFFGLNLFFALLIWWSGENRPSCIYDNGAVFGTTSAPFSDAFALSWTTFSTSGYGVIFPATSAVEPDVKKCIGITLITSLESFVGVLFGSCCGAVIFGKISRIQSYAQVIFSDPIVIRYGKGVLAGHDDDVSSVGSAAKGGENGEARQPLPCPVLEFRLVNTFHSKTGGEIIDASMNIIASIDERQACPTIRAAARRHRRKGKKKSQAGTRNSSRTPLRRNQMNQMGSNSLSISAIPETMPFSKSEKESNHSSHSGYSSHPSYNKNHQAFQEDPSGHLIPPRIFSRLALQAGHDHPFFKRVWVAQHVIDEHSPLLKAEARQMVHRNHGYWPEELNSYEAVRDSIHFDQILVSFSGTSNVDASSVYAQKAYQWIDLNVGYRFVNLLYRDDRDGSLRVDTSLINDVVEQAGGGGEPFIEVDGDHNHHDMLIL